MAAVAITVMSRKNSGDKMTLMLSMNETTRAPDMNSLTLSLSGSKRPPRYSEGGPGCNFAKRPGQIEPLPPLPNLAQTAVSAILGRTSLLSRVPRWGIFTSPRRNLWRPVLLKALAPSYERIVKPSSNPSAAGRTKHLPRRTLTPYRPYWWK